VAACEKYLRDHDGVVYFAAGVRAEAFDQPVNDKDWDVALHLVFADKAAHDKYARHPQHLKFIAENKAAWSKVRVFDSEIVPPKKK
ncbi:MAG TPA: Dabb family protein, partial [Fimbriiglobus sp.]|nr:Dabb family protein [Fimbriiglobus sp.]